MTKKRRVTAIPDGDPDTQAWLHTATRNKAARTQRQRYEAARIRLDVRTARGLKDALAHVAAEQNISISQLAAFLITWSLILYHSDDDQLLEALDRALKPSRSLKHDWELNIAPLLKRLTKLANTPPGQPRSETTGASTGET